MQVLRELIESLFTSATLCTRLYSAALIINVCLSVSVIFTSRSSSKRPNGSNWLWQTSFLDLSCALSCKKKFVYQKIKGTSPWSFVPKSKLRIILPRHVDRRQHSSTNDRCLFATLSVHFLYSAMVVTQGVARVRLRQLRFV